MPGTGFDPVISRCLRISAHWDMFPYESGALPTRPPGQCMTDSVAVVLKSIGRNFQFCIATFIMDWEEDDTR